MEYQRSLIQDADAAEAYDTAMADPVSAAMEVEKFGLDNPADNKFEEEVLDRVDPIQTHLRPTLGDVREGQVQTVHGAGVQHLRNKDSGPLGSRGEVLVEILL